MNHLIVSCNSYRDTTSPAKLQCHYHTEETEMQSMASKTRPIIKCPNWQRVALSLSYARYHKGTERVTAPQGRLTYRCLTGDKGTEVVWLICESLSWLKRKWLAPPEDVRKGLCSEALKDKSSQHIHSRNWTVKLDRLECGCQNNTVPPPNIQIPIPGIGEYVRLHGKDELRLQEE